MDGAAARATRTSARELFGTDGILMTNVDTGWITDERPHLTKVRSKGMPPFDAWPRCETSSVQVAGDRNDGIAKASVLTLCL